MIFRKTNCSFELLSHTNTHPHTETGIFNTLFNVATTSEVKKKSNTSSFL